MGPINPVSEGGDGSVVQEQGDTAVAGPALLGCSGHTGVKAAHKLPLRRIC